MTQQPQTAQLPPHASLYRKLAAVAGAIVAVEKDSRNKDQGYRYASPASVMSAVKPLLAEQQLAIVPHLVEFQEIDSGQRAGSGKPFIINRVLMHYHILDGDSGDELVVPWQGQAGTYGDDKGLAKAQTIALRTFLIQLFQIPAEDPETDPDARDARPQVQQPRQAPARPTAGGPTEQAAKKTPSRPALLGRIAALTAEADQADLDVVLLKPLEEMSDAELIEHGKNLKAAIEQAQQAQQPTEAAPA